MCAAIVEIMISVPGRIETSIPVHSNSKVRAWERAAGRGAGGGEKKKARMRGNFGHDGNIVPTLVHLRSK